MDIKIGKIEHYKFYLDKAFRRGKTKLDITKVKDKSWTRGEKYQYLEVVRISVIRDSLLTDMNKILNIMPHYSELDDFYKEIFPCFVDLDNYKLCLGNIKWLVKRVNALYGNHQNLIKKSDKADEIISIRNRFIARLSSIFKQVEGSFYSLDQDRRKIKDIPVVKTSLYTVAIAGFPNVGKTTLLSKITTSTPEINSYAFTTKGLMIGYLKKEKEKIKIQMIDTPGTLNRIDKMNNIEKMAHLCMRDVSDIIVYVFDLTETYPIEDQIKLYKKILELKKELIVYFSKSDLLDVKKIDAFIKTHKIKGTFDLKELEENIIKCYNSK